MHRTLTILKIVLIAPWLVVYAISLYRGWKERKNDGRRKMAGK